MDNTIITIAFFILAIGAFLIAEWIVTALQKAELKRHVVFNGHSFKRRGTK